MGSLVEHQLAVLQHHHHDKSRLLADALHWNLQWHQQTISRACSPWPWQPSWRIWYRGRDLKQTTQGHRRPIIAVLQIIRSNSATKRRLIGGDLLVLTKSPSTALGKDHCLVHQCQCNGLGPQATSTAWILLQIKQCPCVTETCMIDQNLRFGSPQ